MQSSSVRWVIVVLIGALSLIGCGTQEPGTRAASSAQPTATTATGLVQGRVTTAAGVPIAEVPVGAQSVGNTQPVPALGRLTDQEGRYTWQLPAGNYFLMVGTITKTVDLQAGQTVTLDFVDP